MFNTLSYPCFNIGALVGNVIGETVTSCGNPIFNWFLCGKLPESPVVTPSDVTQVIVPSANNKYISSIVVSPITTTALTVTPSTEEQTFSAGYYRPVVVEATT